MLNANTVFVDISQSAWQMAGGADITEFPLERLDNGKLTDACRERVTAGVRAFLGKASWNSRRRAFVAIGARGVSLRRMSLPPASKEDFQRVIRLQIESEFPLPPDELAWGWQPVKENGGRQEVLVAAVKKEIIAQYAEIFTSCGMVPTFTLAALVRLSFMSLSSRSCSVLHVGSTESEWLVIEDGFPVSIRHFAWGSASNAPKPSAIPANAEIIAGEKSATLAGFKKWAANEGNVPRLTLETGESPREMAGVSSWKWAAAAVFLLLALLCFPWLEALAFQPHLAKKLAAIEADSVRLPAIDHELEFLQFIKRSQPPYLDTIYLLSKSSPPGTSFDSITMGRKGELNLRGKMQNPQMVTDFRSNLMASAWFSSVVVEEQSPSPDRRVSVRMTAQLKPIDSRKPIVIDVPATNSVATKPSKPLKK